MYCIILFHVLSFLNKFTFWKKKYALGENYYKNMFKILRNQVQFKSLLTCLSVTVYQPGGVVVESVSVRVVALAHAADKISPVDKSSCCRRRTYRRVRRRLARSYWRGRRNCAPCLNELLYHPHLTPPTLHHYYLWFMRLNCSHYFQPNRISRCYCPLFNLPRSTVTHFVVCESFLH